MEITTKIQKKNANAKINIYLQVLNKRLDNFHNINSLFYPIPLCDEIIISENNELKLECDTNLNINNNENIVFKAALKIQEFAIKHKKIKITPKIELKKRIPVGAGLGGGSSDAATTLLALNQFYNLNISINTLHKIAISLGSDVPFFLYNSTAIISGRGELITPIKFNINKYLLLIFPNIYINTHQAYKLLDRNINYSFSLFEPNLNNNIKNILLNDFEEPIFSMYPELFEIKTKLMKISNNKALMSGSGSSIFAFFDNEKELYEAKKEFNNKNYFIFSCKL